MQSRGSGARRTSDLHAVIRETVRRLDAEVRLRDREASHRLRLSDAASRVLTLLALHGPLSPGRLATLTGLTTGGTTTVIDRLERANLVSRRRDSTDRRKLRVVPLPDALTRLFVEHRDGPDRLDAVLHRRDATELAIIARFLEQMTDAWDRGGEPR